MKRSVYLLGVLTLLVLVGGGCAGSKDSDAVPSPVRKSRPVPTGSIYTSQEYGFSVIVSSACDGYYSAVDPAVDAPNGSLASLDVNAEGFGKAFSYAVMTAHTYGILSSTEGQADEGAMREDVVAVGNDTMDLSGATGRLQVVKTLDDGLLLTSRSMPTPSNVPDGCSLRIE